MKCFYLLFIVFSFICCKNEPIEIFSNIDATNHENILNGPNNTEKHILNLIYEKDTSLSDLFFKGILIKMGKAEKEWRVHAFHAMTYYCDNINSIQRVELQLALFDYFLHHPSEYMQQVGNMKFNKSDCFLSLFSQYVQYYLKTNNITIVSMKNVAYKHCDNCNDSQISDIYSYLELASRFQKE